MSDHRAPSDNKRRHPRWLAIAGVLLGLLYVGGGIGYLSWSSRRAPGGAERSPALTQVPASAVAAARQATLDAAASSLASMRATAAAQPTPMDTPTPQPTLTIAPGLIELVILHSNDTWGYTLPCG